MGMTATQLGAIFGRGAAAMNVLLKEHGFLEGGPGAWMRTNLESSSRSRTTSITATAATHTGRGAGSSLTDGLVDALRASIEQNPDGIATAVPTSVAKAGTVATNGNTGPAFGRNKWVALAAVGVVAAAAPAAMNAWNRLAQRRSAADTASVVGGPPVDEAVPDVPRPTIPRLTTLRRRPSRRSSRTTATDPTGALCAPMLTH